MNTLTFFAPSGAPSANTLIQQLDPPGNTSGSNYVGFFGAGGPQGVPFAVIVGSYQDSTYITNRLGENLGVAPFGLSESGQLNNSKFISTNEVQVNSDPTVNLSDVPMESGTILVRFEPSGSVAVRTQNAIIRAVNLNATSGVSDITGIVDEIDIRGFEPAVDNTWTQIAGVAASDNRLFLQDRQDTELVHDFFVSLSASPEGVGARNDFGFFMTVEFL